jgi:hypothetical protein
MRPIRRICRSAIAACLHRRHAQRNTRCADRYVTAEQLAIAAEMVNFKIDVMNSSHTHALP